MPALTYFSDDLLQPISAEQPSGVDLRYTPLFTEIAEARRSDDDLSFGVWEMEGGRKNSEWSHVAELCTGALRQHTKDLRIAVYLAEAAIRLDGFEGLRDSLRLIRELLRNFGNLGLFPLVEDGDMEFRVSPLDWLGEQMPVLLGQVPITARTGAENYSYRRYEQALEVGTEASWAGLSAENRDTRQGLVRQGYITMDQFETALKASRRAPLEAVYQVFDEASQELLELEKIADEQFGASAPGFSAAKERFTSIRKILAPVLKKKQEEDRDQKGSPQPQSSQPVSQIGSSVEVTDSAGSSPGGNEWGEAQSLIQAGSVDQGLAQMAALAARETSGRGRFLRKLLLSEVCIKNGRERMARTILEELNAQINDFKLDRWESSGLVGPVWTRLYRLYKKSDNSADQDRSLELYNRLCSLDPWQAYMNIED